MSLDNRLFLIVLVVAFAVIFIGGPIFWKSQGQAQPSIDQGQPGKGDDQALPGQIAIECDAWKTETTPPIVEAARKYLGVEYSFGGRMTIANPGIDCMGLVFLAWAEVSKQSWQKLSVSGVKIIREEQLGTTVPGLNGVAAWDADICLLKPGDIVFLLGSTENSNEAPLKQIDGEKHWIWHMGIYTGQGKWINADPAARRVIEVDLMDYVDRFALYDAIWAVRPLL